MIENITDLAQNADIIEEEVVLSKFIDAHEDETKLNATPVRVPSQQQLLHREVEKMPFRRINLNVSSNTFRGTQATAEILQEIGGSAGVHAMTTLFYEKCINDAHLFKFIANTGDPHAQRLSNWIVEKMGGEGTPWTRERAQRSKCPVHVTLGDGRDHVVHDRTSAHVAAWFSPKRPMEEIGERFKLHDARVWMRLMFWAAREVGIFKVSPTFEYWFPQFIAHFMSIYERSAPPFAAESLKWSANPRNIDEYIADGNRMNDVFD